MNAAGVAWDPTPGTHDVYIADNSAADNRVFFLSGVLSASLAPGVRVARAAAAKKVTLKLEGTDNVSGFAGVQVTPSKRKPGKVLKFKKSLKVRPAKKLYVRVRDRAGNFSPWRTAKKR